MLPGVGAVHRQPRELRVFMTADAVGGIWPYALDLARGLSDLRVPDLRLEVTLALLGPAPGSRQVVEAAGVAGLRLLPTGLPLDWTAPDAASVHAGSVQLGVLARRAGADIVHLNNPAFAASGNLGTAPLLIVCHSCVASWWDAAGAGELPADLAWRHHLTGIAYRTADRLVAPSATFAAATAGIHGLAALPQVIHNGRTPASAVRPRQPGAFAFTAGRLWDAGKNLAVLDRAAARLPVPFLAAGPLQGPDGAQVRLQHLRLLGRLDGEGVAARLAARPVFASAARYEPFGLAVLEAAQAGCALVLSDIAGFRELWGEAACYVAPDDDAGFADAICSLLRDPARRHRLGEAAEVRSARYTVDAMAAGTMKLYREMLPQHPAFAAPAEAGA